MSVVSIELVCHLCLVFHTSCYCKLFDMNSVFRNIIKNTCEIWVPQVTSVRFRYHSEKIAKGPLIKRYGYNEKIFTGGLLPRVEGARILPMPDYTPNDAWSRRRALFGQNDYIDILGNGKLHPTQISYNVPIWLRGVKGDEYNILLRQRKVMKHGIVPLSNPTRWRNIRKNLTYLYKFLNRKTKTPLTRQ